MICLDYGDEINGLVSSLWLDRNLFLSRLNDRNAFDRLENDDVALRNP